MPNTKELSKVKLPNGEIYDIKDAVARADIQSLKDLSAAGVSYEGVTTTELIDGSTVAAIILKDGDTTKEVTAKKGTMVSYNNVMFAWNGEQWDQLGSDSPIKALAYKDSVSGTATPSGKISEQTFTGDKTTVSATFTPDGKVAVSAAAPGTDEVANYTPAGTVSAPKFTGKEGDVSVTGKADGDVTIAVGDGTANYTPAGTLKNLKTEVTPTTATVNSITDVGTLPSWDATVQNETLEFNFGTGTLPTKGEDQAVVSGIKSAATTGEFEGTGVDLTASFAGKSTVSTGKFTPEGENAAPGFTGTGTVIKGTFTGSEETVSADVTPTGKVSAATFTGDALTVESK